MRIASYLMLAGLIASVFFFVLRLGAETPEASAMKIEIVQPKDI